MIFCHRVQKARQFASELLMDAMSLRYNYPFNEVRWAALDFANDLLIGGIELLNRHKDDALADRLHELAGMYQRHPLDGWSPPADWECWAEVSFNAQEPLA